MTTYKSRWLLVGLLCLALWPVQALAQQGPWERYMRAGIVADQQGNYAEAEKHYEAGLRIAEGFGPQDPRLAINLDNLAQLYHHQGRYAEAEPLYKRSLGIVEKTFWPAHPEVATILNNMAGLYRAQGHYADAEPLYNRSLGIWEKTLGPEHPNVATSLDNFADLLRKTGRDAEAAMMETRAKKMRTKHPEWMAR